ncbi:MAG TPA: 4-(cytidine 5'-diphospho)-2-C-methyl-D-erythritol kinase [Candidatus Sulfotelmatobacter sp.]|jgi:4-diphosphocytidyl-2-C-methyl-D-erythritol kinase|nr:4-(cytidine 5'-diphospho)-2-C-methyl-D-erythritol kinase [Candidatus Sulfotelmatobacter sp.]
MTVTVRSFAKINLGLRIGAARADGFHELLTVYQTIGLHDLIRVSLSRGSGIEIRCDDPRVPRDESNTCYRIVEKTMRALKGKGRVVIEIEKRLPVQGGMGGASSNAVATLLGLERVIKKALPAEERLQIAAEVGSDLPLFLIGGTVLGVGRGEQVYPLEDLPATACVVVTPEVGVSTPRAFAEWDRKMQGLKPALSVEPNAALKGRSSTVLPGSVGAADADGLRPAGQLSSAVPTKSFSRQTNSSKLTLSGSSDRMVKLGRELSAWLSESYSGAPFRRGRAENPLLALVRAGIKNDFEEVVFPEYPELSEGKRALERAGAKYASLSGSGSTLYGLFASKEAASTAVTKLRKQGWAAQATVTLRRKQYWAKFLVSSF